MNPVTMYGFSWQNRQHLLNDNNSFVGSTAHSTYSGSQSSSISMLAPSTTLNIRNPYFTNDIEMEEIPDEEPMDFEITPPQEPQHSASVAQQVAQDEMLARMLQAQYYAEARISFRRSNGRVQLNLHSSRQLQNSQLQRLQEDLQSISLLLRTWTPFIVQERYEDVVDIFFELGHRSRGLKRSQINALPTRQFSSSVSSGTNCDESSPKDCSICLSEYVNGDTLRILPCFHKFHVACIDKWLKSHNNCPLCRNEIPRQ